MILHADLDAFFAAVEQRDDPSLLGRPVIVGSWVVLAASYEAKNRGVRTAMSVARALRLCPGAVVVEPPPGTGADRGATTVAVRTPRFLRLVAGRRAPPPGRRSPAFRS